MRNQDPRGRRGQPLQDREPLPGAEDEELRPQERGATVWGRCGIAKIKPKK